MDKKRILENVIAPISGLALFIILWCVAAAAVGKSILLPSPTETVSGFFSLLSERTFYLAVGKTLGRTLIGFLLAFSLASIFALLSKAFFFFRKAFAPITVIIRVLPTISIILLVLIWIKSRFAPFVITFIVLFPMLYTTILNAADGVDPGLVEMSKVYGLSLGKKVRSLYLPAMIPSILTGISLTLSFSVKLTVAAEVLASAQDSMGRYMSQASAYIETPMLLAWTLAAILLGFLLEGTVLLIKKMIVRHYRGN